MNTMASIFVPLMVAILGASFFAYLTAARQSKAVAAGGPAYQNLAEEYRRLSELAITSSEHVDLRLTEIGVQVDELRRQLDQMQLILKEVE
jgi:hypothetical protein